jgi:threonine synthase
LSVDNKADKDYNRRLFFTLWKVRYFIMTDLFLHCPLCGEKINPVGSFISTCPVAAPGESHVPEFVTPMCPVSSEALKEPGANPYLLFGESMFFQKLAEKFNLDYAEVVNFIGHNLVKNCHQPDFHITPLTAVSLFSDRSEVYVKNETGNVSGSHKARHLMGTMLYLEILRLAGVLAERVPLAVYSCGNAGFAASVLAKAGGDYPLQAFVPDDVHENIAKGLLGNGADVCKMSRQPGETGDPCYKAFCSALEAGALAFSCSGPDNWSNIEGGKTIGFELFSQMSDLEQELDVLFVQTGGGALGSSVQAASRASFQAGLIKKEPAIACVQTESAYPLVRAWLLMLKELCSRLLMPCPFSTTELSSPEKINLIYSSEREFLKEATQKIKQNFTGETVQSTLTQAGKNMSGFMWEWESAPKSIAHGILDDITYDWLSLLSGHFRSGGIPVVVSEMDLRQANELAVSKTNIPVDHTGTAGLAGLLAAKRYGIITGSDRVGLLFTGRKR